MKKTIKTTTKKNTIYRIFLLKIYIYVDNCCNEYQEKKKTCINL